MGMENANEEKADVLSSYFSLVFSQKTVYAPPGKCEVQREGMELQPEIDKQIVKEHLTA